MVLSVRLGGRTPHNHTWPSVLPIQIHLSVGMQFPGWLSSSVGVLTFSSSACLRIPRLSSLVICTWASHTGQVSREVDGKFTEENRLLMTSYAYVSFLLLSFTWWKNISTAHLRRYTASSRCIGNESPVLTNHIVKILEVIRRGICVG